MDRPDVIVILVDTLRADHLGSYGYHRDTSPVLDELARDGVRFSRCIAQSSTTPPSTASVLTGLYPPSHGHLPLLAVLPPGTPMMPDQLSQHGYRTAFLSTNPLISRTFGFAREVDLYRGESSRGPCLVSLFQILVLGRKLEERVLGLGRWGAAGSLEWLWLAAHRSLYDRPDVPDDAAWLQAELLAWLDAPDPRPGFAYVHYMEPHLPYDPEPPFAPLFQDPGYAGPALRRPPKTVNAFPPLTSGPALPSDQYEHLVARYDGEIRDFDHHLGELIEALRQRDRYDSTLIVVTADHGEEFYEHGAWTHGHSLYQELIHVPLVIKLPGGRHAGRVVDGQVRGVDVLPTILELIEVERWPGIQGESLVPMIDGEEAVGPGRAAYAEVLTRGFRARCLIEGSTKLIGIELGGEHWLLYDLEHDPAERHSRTKLDPTGFEAMRDRLEERTAVYQTAASVGATGAISEEMEKRLRELGYLE